MDHEEKDRKLPDSEASWPLWSEGALIFWSGRRDLNPRLRPWQGRTLPLSYSRSEQIDYKQLVKTGSNTRTLKSLLVCCAALKRSSIGAPWFAGPMACAYTMRRKRRKTPMASGGWPF